MSETAPTRSESLAAARAWLDRLLLYGERASGEIPPRTSSSSIAVESAEPEPAEGTALKR